MLRNRVWLLAAILALSIPLLATNAPAWEFTMDGTFTSDFDYITQGGPNGFFGPYDNDFSAKPFYLETANAWLGQRAGNNLVSGSDYSRNSQYMSTIELLYVLILAGFVGFEVIKKVTPTLHTPLMSATNAISGISLVGSLVAAGSDHQVSQILGFVAVTAATINVVGGFLITERMLKMFKRKERKS